MPVPAAQKLLTNARAGEKLSHKDRRHVIGFLLGSAPGMSNTELAELFQVSERMIRFDKKAIREELAKELQNLDPGLIIADIIVMRDLVLDGIHKSLNVAKIGTRTYLEHLLALDRVSRETVKTLQDLGALPKELGHVQIDEYKYQANVIKGSTVVTHRVEHINGRQEIEVLLDDHEARNALDAEYMDVPKLPAHKPEPVPVNAQAQSSHDSSGVAADGAARAQTAEDGNVSAPTGA